VAAIACIALLFVQDHFEYTPSTPTSKESCISASQQYYLGVKAVNRMFKEIQSAEASGEYINYINRLSRAKILIFDDFGLRNYTHTEATI
jgi:hypothetical protein